MLDLLEKIGAAISGLFILVTVVGYLAIKIPSPTSMIWMPDVVDAAPAETPEPAKAQPGPPTITPEDQAILDKLIQQDRKVTIGQVKKEPKTVPVKLFEFLSTEANVLPTLRTARSSAITTKNGQTRLQIQNIQTDSALKKLGFKDNDVIELIDGEIIQFDQQSSARYYSMWRDKVAAIREGKPVTVTFTRAGKVMHLEYRLPTGGKDATAQ